MATTLSTTIYEYVDQGSDDGCIIASASSEKVGFYGKAPVSQRPYSSAVHASSALATSSDFGATQLAAVQEIQKTLVGLGIWATA
jgi:hypothetical protein